MSSLPFTARPGFNRFTKLDCFLAVGRSRSSQIHSSCHRRGIEAQRFSKLSIGYSSLPTDDNQRVSNGDRLPVPAPAAQFSSAQSAAVHCSAQQIFNIYPLSDRPGGQVLSDAMFYVVYEFLASQQAPFYRLIELRLTLLAEAGFHKSDVNLNRAFSRRIVNLDLTPSWSLF